MANNENSNVRGGGISFCGAAGLTFIVLKLCHVIDWSWWWVTAPFWGGLALFLFFVLIGLVIEVLKIFFVK